MRNNFNIYEIRRIIEQFGRIIERMYGCYCTIIVNQEPILDDIIFGIKCNLNDGFECMYSQRISIHEFESPNAIDIIRQYRDYIQSDISRQIYQHYIETPDNSVRSNMPYQNTMVDHPERYTEFNYMGNIYREGIGEGLRSTGESIQSDDGFIDDGDDDKLYNERCGYE